MASAHTKKQKPTSGKFIGLLRLGWCWALVELLAGRLRECEGRRWRSEGTLAKGLPWPPLASFPWTLDGERERTMAWGELDFTAAICACTFDLGIGSQAFR